MSMSAPSQPNLRQRTTGLASRIIPDKRRHKRIAVTLKARFMRANRQEFECKLADISIGGARFIASQAVDLGERIVVQIDELGNLEGTVGRLTDNGFVVLIQATQQKREKLAAQLTWLANRTLPQAVPQRRHERITPGNPQQPLTLSEGLTITCRVIDVSLSGASIETPARPDIGTELMLGSLKAKVVRHHPTGIGIAFAESLSESTISRSFD